MSLFESDFMEPAHLDTTMGKLHGVIGSLNDRATPGNQPRANSARLSSIQQNSRLISVGAIAALGGILAVLIAAEVGQNVALGTLAVQLLVTVVAAVVGVLFVFARQTASTASEELPLFRTER